MRENLTRGHTLQATVLPVCLTVAATHSGNQESWRVRGYFLIGAALSGEEGGRKAIRLPF